MRYTEPMRFSDFIIYVDESGDHSSGWTSVDAHPEGVTVKGALQAGGERSASAEMRSWRDGSVRFVER